MVEREYDCFGLFALEDLPTLQAGHVVKSARSLVVRDPQAYGACFITYRIFSIPTCPRHWWSLYTASRRTWTGTAMQIGIVAGGIRPGMRLYSPIELRRAITIDCPDGDVYVAFSAENVMEPPRRSSV